MKLSLYQVDAFTDRIFGGNPASVCILNEWLPDNLLQSIAAENNQAETAFIVGTSDKYDIRWFTPIVEVDLCGHATLAAAHVLFHEMNLNGNIVHFYSHRSGILPVVKQSELLTLDFPTDVFSPIDTPEVLIKGISIMPLEAYRGKTDYLAIVASEQDITNIQPDLDAIAQLGGRGLIVSAKGDNCDFVSRFFAPQSGINEDPVTGSAHTTLTKYWYEKLGKRVMHAEQLSKRKGYLQCVYNGDRVNISGKACTYLEGVINIDI
jgi:PhzF family phenazine biosynthesis protein